MKKQTMFIERREAGIVHQERVAYYVAADVADLETRLIACETAMLLGSNVNHPGIQTYFAKYPEPYIPS